MGPANTRETHGAQFEVCDPPECAEQYALYFLKDWSHLDGDPAVFSSLKDPLSHLFPSAATPSPDMPK